MIKSGVIKLFRTEKGFAIIAQDDGGPDVFLHFSSIVDVRIREQMCVGLPVVFEIEKGPKGFIAQNCRADIKFTWMDLPAELLGGVEVAVRDDRDGTVEVFFDKNSARAWMTLRRGQKIGKIDA